jgi:murein hydrolase activator
VIPIARAGRLFIGRGLCALLLAGVVVLVPFATPFATTPEQLKKTITREKGKAEEQKTLLKRLTSEERTLYKNLAAIEDRMAGLERGLETQKQELVRTAAEANTLNSRLAVLEKQQNETMKAIQSLLRSLWPLHMQSVQTQLNAYSSWADADRQFTWTAAVYQQVEQSFRDIATQSARLTETMAAHEQAKARHLTKLDEIDRTKERLLGERLAFLSRVQEVRAKKLENEENLQNILAAIESMQFELKNLTTTRHFKGQQGAIPWPVTGEVISTFDLAANPPRRGIGLSLKGQEQVAAVSWGKVVHNDQLRGFGQVVILTHGSDFYSLYAFLSESPLKVGQNVERGESVGRAGYYPLARGPGLYFELRSGQKAVNPLQWLSTAKEAARRP